MTDQNVQNYPMNRLCPTCNIWVPATVPFCLFCLPVKPEEKKEKEEKKK